MLQTMSDKKHLYNLGLGYVVTGILYRGLCSDALNDPNLVRVPGHIDAGK